MSSVRYKITSHVQKQENVTYNKKKMAINRNKHPELIVGIKQNKDLKVIDHHFKVSTDRNGCKDVYFQTRDKKNLLKNQIKH